MANKYIIDEATYNGDGTSNSEATSNGGVGAWNTITYYEGTTPAYGTLAAGDVVYIRSKKSNGNSITKTLPANQSLGSSAATAALPISWIIDNGDIWEGVDGVITYTSSAGYSTTFLSNNNLKCQTRGSLALINTGTSAASGTMSFIYGVVNGIKLDFTAKTGTNNVIAAQLTGILENPIIKCGRLGANITQGLLSAIGTTSTKILFINPDIELQYPTPAGQIIFGLTSSYSCTMVVLGGKIYGAGITSAQVLSRNGATNASTLDIIGMAIPKELIQAVDITTFIRTTITAADTSLGGHIEEIWGYATSRSDNNPPTLSAKLPNSVETRFSYRIYPRNTSPAYPVKLTSMQLFTEEDAIKNIYCEFLVANTLAVTSKNTWLSICYTDSSGDSCNITTRFVDEALSSSGALWTGRSGDVVPWGMVTLNPYKLVLVTPTAIKKDTPILVTFFTILNAAGNTSNILFLDPDFYLTTP